MANVQKFTECQPRQRTSHIAHNMHAALRCCIKILFTFAYHVLCYSYNKTRKRCIVQHWTLNIIIIIFTNLWDPSKYTILVSKRTRCDIGMLWIWTLHWPEHTQNQCIWTSWSLLSCTSAAKYAEWNFATIISDHNWFETCQKPQSSNQHYPKSTNSFDRWPARFPYAIEIWPIGQIVHTLSRHLSRTLAHRTRT